MVMEIGRDGVYQVWSGSVFLDEEAASAGKFMQASVWMDWDADKSSQTWAHSLFSRFYETERQGVKKWVARG